MTVPPPPAGTATSEPDPTPSAFPAPPRRPPSRAWYWCAGTLAAVGIALAGWGLWMGIASFQAVGDFPRVEVPGQAEISLEAGSYTVYYEAAGVAADGEWSGDGFDDGGDGSAETPPPALDVVMEPLGDAQPVTLARGSTSSTYQVGAREGRSMWQFDLDRAGRYEVTVTGGGDGGPPATVAFGHGIGWGLVGMVLALFAAFGFVLAAAVVGGVTAVLRHSRRPAPAG